LVLVSAIYKNESRELVFLVCLIWDYTGEGTMARVREPPMASNDDSASLLVDEWSPAAVTPARGSSALRRLLHGGKQATTRPATTTTRSHDVKRFLCSPFAAVFRAMSCARDAAVRTCDEQQPGSNNGTGGGVVAERRREAARRRRPSLEQLLRMEARAPPPASARPDHQQRKLVVGKPREAAAAAPYEVISSCAAVKGNKEQEPLFPSAPQSHFVAAVSDDGERRRRTTIVPVKLEAGAGGPGRQTNAKRLVVVFASLRACSRAPRINDGKVAAAGRAPGKAELFYYYYRPIPMGRRCRVQHLEESPYSSDLSSLLDLGQM
jgi:hypothetical protein